MIVFVPGGAWIIGYKMWGYFLALTLMENDTIVICPDHRNFPEVSCGDMLADVDAALEWSLLNVEALGGDRNNITLMGQSAGAHLTATLMLLRVKKKISSPFRRYVGISGPFDLSKIVPTMHDRGLHKKLVTKGLFENDVDKFDPVKIAASLTVDEVKLLPDEMILWHGRKDETCPCIVTKTLADTLSRSGYFRAKYKIFDNDTHTSLVIENPLQGKDDVANMLLDALHPSLEASKRVWPPARFAFCARVAAYVNPF